MRCIAVNNGIFHKVQNDNGYICPVIFANALNLSAIELASIIGAPKSLINNKTYIHLTKTQSRLNDVLNIFRFITPWCGSTEYACSWFINTMIPGFCYSTAKQLVRQGRADAVMTYLEQIKEGSYA